MCVCRERANILLEILALFSTGNQFFFLLLPGMFVSSSSIHPHEPVRTLKVGVRACVVVCAEKRGKQCKKVRDGDVTVYQTRCTGTVATAGD